MNLNKTPLEQRKWLSKLDNDMRVKMIGAFGSDMDVMLLRELRLRKLNDINGLLK